jgi:hypothetical protein
MSFYNLQGRRFLGKDTSEELHGLQLSAGLEVTYHTLLLMSKIM